MKNILCFGDSNTYGYKADGTGRFDFSVRYPGRLQLLLGEEYHVIEEGLPGRTTVFENRNSPYKSGLGHIVPCLQSTDSLAYVLVMLGTNDCKTAYHASAEEIVHGLSKIIGEIRRYAPAAEIIIISPIHLGNNTGKPGFDPEFDARALELSKSLAVQYRKLAEITGCAFLDAAETARASPIDEEHLDEEGHKSLAEAVAAIIKAERKP